MTIIKIRILTNNYQEKLSIKSINASTKQYLDFLINPNFQGVNKFLVLSFEHNVYYSVYTMVCDSNESKFIKKQKASGLLSNLGIRNSFSKIRY